MKKEKILTADMLMCGSNMHLMGMGMSREKWCLTLVGFRSGRYLLVEMPRIAGAPIKLEEGSEWAATFLSHGHMYTFKTEVLAHSFRLAPLLFLRYPSGVEISNLRSTKRYPVNIPMTFEIKSTPPSQDGQQEVELSQSMIRALVADISENGFLMATTISVPEETVIEGIFYMPAEEPICGILAISRLCRPKPGGFSVGLSFLPTNLHETTDRVAVLINNIEHMPLRL